MASARSESCLVPASSDTLLRDGGEPTVLGDHAAEDSSEFRRLKPGGRCGRLVWMRGLEDQNLRTFVFLLLMLVAGDAISGEGSGPAALGTMPQSHSGDERRNLLEVRRAQIELSQAHSDLERIKLLADQGLVSASDIERAEAAYSRAEINIQESMLSLLSTRAHISVVRAVKVQDPGGNRWVKLTIRNLTPPIDEEYLRVLTGGKEPLSISPSLMQRKVRDVFVSLKGTGEGTAPLEGGALRGTTVALPYEFHIQELAYGEARTLSFRLIRDVESVNVTLNSGDQQWAIEVVLEQAESDRGVEVTSVQISQEADLGSQATYDLRLDRSTADERSFELKVVNLPQEITYSFIDPANEARLSQISFPAGVTQRRLSLRVFLPERPSKQVNPDQTIKFYALALSSGQAVTINKAHSYSTAEIETTNAGYVVLEIVPRGVGRISIDAPTLYEEIEMGQEASMELVIRNSGTRRLHNIEIIAEGPTGWNIRATPSTLPELPPGRHRQVSIKAAPPRDLAVGDYEIRLRSESFAYNRRIPSEEKIYRVSVRSGSNLFVMFSLLAILGGLFAVVAAVVVKATRR